MRLRSGIALLAFAVASNAEVIRLDPGNPHYFRFGGSTVALITSGEHYGAVLNADFDYRRYLDALSADKLNYTRLFGGAYIEVPAKSFGILRNDLAPARPRLISPWASDGVKYDLSRWNPAYFERLHDFLSQASRRGIAVELTFFSSEYDEAQWDVSPFNSKNNSNGTTAIDWKLLHTLKNGNIKDFQERYVRKLVHEVNVFDNVIFELQNEPWSDRPAFVNVINPYLPLPGRDKFPNVREVADELSVQFQMEVKRWVTSEESSLPNKHLIAQNYANFGLPVRALDPGISVINFHYAYPEAAAENYGVGKVISYDETGFLGRADDSYRRQAWNFLLSGGGAFDGLDYSFSPGHEDGNDTESNGPGGGSPAFRRQLGILSSFLNTASLSSLRLDRTTVLHAGGAVPRVLSNPGAEYKIYLDGRGPSTVTLNLPAGLYSAEWVNPETGNVERQDTIRAANAPTELRSPDFAEGIALRIEARH